MRELGAHRSKNSRPGNCRGERFGLQNGLQTDPPFSIFCLVILKSTCIFPLNFVWSELRRYCSFKVPLQFAQKLMIVSENGCVTYFANCTLNYCLVIERQLETVPLEIETFCGLPHMQSMSRLHKPFPACFLFFWTLRLRSMMAKKVSRNCPTGGLAQYVVHWKSHNPLLAHCLRDF